MGTEVSREIGMHTYLPCFLILCACLYGCSNPKTINESNWELLIPIERSDSTHMLSPGHLVGPGNGALLLTRFHSFEEFRKTVHIAYGRNLAEGNENNKQVRLLHHGKGGVVESILHKGVSERDFVKARDSGFWAKVSLLFRSPYSIWNRKKLGKMYALSRRRGAVFGEGDVAFFDLAETMTEHISSYDKAFVPAKDLTDKGYINTFNHVVSQAFVTSVYSEKLADFIADSHERFAMPELITGSFTAAQKADVENGPTDNYLDMINNEWGQELGKELAKRYGINRKTVWTPELLADYLNDIQAYFSWSFHIGFSPYTTKDEVIIRFVGKINTVMQEAPVVR